MTDSSRHFRISGGIARDPPRLLNEETRMRVPPWPAATVTCARSSLRQRQRIVFGLCWSGSGLTLRSESGILSRPASPLASLPPDVDVPLPLGFDRVEY